METFGFMIAVIVLLAVGACVLAPLLLGSMSKEEKDKAGIKYKEEM